MIISIIFDFFDRYCLARNVFNISKHFQQFQNKFRLLVKHFHTNNKQNIVYFSYQYECNTFIHLFNNRLNVLINIIK